MQRMKRQALRPLGVGLLLAIACAAATASGASTTHVSSPRVILYWSMSPWPSLWSVRLDGSNRHRFFKTKQNAKRPRLSPDRKWVAFDGPRPRVKAMSDYDIQVVRVNRTGRRTLTASRLWDMDAQWSPDGRRLAFSRMPVGAVWLKSWIWTITADGKDLHRLVRGQFARWSPDGSKLVFDAPTETSDGDLFVVNADGSSLQQLSSTRELEQPAGWSPDGSKILFTRYGSSPGDGDVYVVAADGSSERKLTKTRGDDIAAEWSPDGGKILFTSQRGGGSHLFVMNADGSRQQKISRSLENEYEPSWR
jgi:TolB protein